MTPLLVLVAHLHRALLEHRRWCRSSGAPFPPELAALVDVLAATGGQTRPALEYPAGPADTAGALTLDYAGAGRRLGVSERTIRRLVAAGDLSAVPVGGRRRIRLTDLQRYVDELGAA